MTTAQKNTAQKSTARKSTAQESAPGDQSGSGEQDVATNDVRLVGRLTAAPAVVELPSGDVLVTFRVSVPRASPPRGVAAAKGQRVDSVPCTAWSPRLRRSILAWRAGDLVEVSGAVRCRFYQAGGATRSRVEVEASAAKIIRRSSAA